MFNPYIFPFHLNPFIHPSALKAFFGYLPERKLKKKISTKDTKNYFQLKKKAHKQTQQQKLSTLKFHFQIGKSVPVSYQQYLISHRVVTSCRAQSIISLSVTYLK